MHEAFAQARKKHAPYDLWWRKYALWLIVRDVDALLALSPEDAAWVRRKLKARAALRQLLTCGFSCDRVLDIMGFWGATNGTLVDALWARGKAPAKGLRLVDGVSTRLWGGLAGRPYSHEAYAASIPDTLLPIMGYDWLRYLCRGPGLVPVSFVARCVQVLPHLPPGTFMKKMTPTRRAFVSGVTASRTKCGPTLWAKTSMDTDACIGPPLPMMPKRQEAESGWQSLKRVLPKTPAEN